jgi:hypothetical protein
MVQQGVTRLELLGVVELKLLAVMVVRLGLEHLLEDLQVL